MPGRKKKDEVETGAEPKKVDIRSHIAFILQELKKRGMPDEIYEDNMKELQKGGTIIIPLSEPNRGRCRLCNAVHGNYTSIEQALKIYGDLYLPPQCRVMAEQWIKNNRGEK